MAGSCGSIELRVDDLKGPEIAALLEEHLADMRQSSPPESVHALDLAELRQPDITFWSAWQDGSLVGCGALRDLGHGHGEIKSMRTSSAHRRKGVARHVLAHIVEQAPRAGISRLSLETGSQPEFQPARTLYEQFGFTYCEPFGSYVQDPNSVFMTKSLIEHNQ